MYSHPYATFTSLYTLSLRDTSLDNFTAEKEDDDEFMYPEVGDVLFIKSRIGNYMQGDFFFVHAQDEDEVSDCSLVGVAALNAGLDETIISDTDIYNDVAEVVTNLGMVEYLWDQHTTNHVINMVCCR